MKGTDSTQVIQSEVASANTTSQVTSKLEVVCCNETFVLSIYEMTHQNCSRKIFTTKIFHAKILAHEIRRYPRTRTTCLCLVPKLATVFILKILKSYLRIFLIHLTHCFFTAVTLGTPGSHALMAWALLKQRRRFHTRTNATLGLSASSVKSRHTDVKFTSRLQAIQKMHLLTQTPSWPIFVEDCGDFIYPLSDANTRDSKWLKERKVSTR